MQAREQIRSISHPKSDATHISEEVAGRRQKYMLRMPCLASTLVFMAGLAPTAPAKAAL